MTIRYIFFCIQTVNLNYNEYIFIYIKLYPSLSIFNLIQQLCNLNLVSVSRFMPQTKVMVKINFA